MNTQTKIYIALAAVTAITFAALIGNSIWTTRKIANLEIEIETARKAVRAADKLAATRETEAAAYKQKLEYLENNLSEIQTIARKQDEQLEKLYVNSRDARSNVERARRTRTIHTTADELCAKLAEVGKGCRQ
jgi:chromosome segregation ATPase